MDAASEPDLSRGIASRRSPRRTARRRTTARRLYWTSRPSSAVRHPFAFPARRLAHAGEGPSAKSAALRLPQRR